MLTQKEDWDMKETLARESLGMGLDEFTEAWKPGRFDDDRKSQAAVVGLAVMRLEYWLD